MKCDYEHFVHEWIESWNSHDLKRILSHYDEDIEVTTPMIRKSGVANQDSLQGKERVGEYWQKALEKFPDLHFTLIDYTIGVNCITVFYESVNGLKAMETMWFDENGLIIKMNACYK